MLYSVIDIGSNTVKSQIYQVENNQITKTKFYTKQLGIIAKINNGILSQCYINELTDTINEYKSYVQSHVFCFATESLRGIRNIDEVKLCIKEKCDLDLELISGTDEALLSFEGLKLGATHIHNGIMVDMGGGSTEIIKFTDREPSNINSFKFGCLSLKRDFVANRFPDSNEIISIQKHVAKLLDDYPWIRETDTLCLVGGTGSAIYKIASELGYTTVPEFSSNTFMQLFDYLSIMGKEQISLLEKHIPARVETIIPGMCAYRYILDTVNAEKVFVSSNGIRDGYLVKKLRG